MDPAALLERHGLPCEGLEPLPGGTVNRVWRTPTHVLRIAARTDHAREARLASAARRAGIATPAVVAWGHAYSIWERWDGQRASAFGRVPPSTWATLLTELDALHHHPLEAAAPVPEGWRGRIDLVARTRARARWSPRERWTLERVLGTTREVRDPTFVHGDAYGDNVLVDAKGTYLGIIDWGCSGWSTLEAEAARLEDDALTLALERWHEHLDVALVWAMRLDLLLEVAFHGRTPFDRVRSLLDRIDRSGT